MDLPQGDLEKLAKLAERGGAGLRDELKRIPDFKEKAEHPLWQMLADLAEDISGLPRHVSQHVGGMIISSRPLVELVPLEPAAMEGRVLCQWDKDGCDDAGFIKIDFLALGMLSLVEEAVDSIALRHGDAPDLSRIDFEDEDVYDRICAGDTIGMFQVESRAQIQMLRRVQPRTLPDLAVQVAIVRPGPIVGGAVNPYVRRRELLRGNPDFQIPYEHPLMEEALGETLGVIIFQDQVLKVCQALAGFTDGQAEGLRRSMSRKRSREAMQSYWEAFREGAAENGVDETTAQTVFQQVIAFSEFGFPKSHAAAFGLLAYQSAWLCHYYPTEFYVALFNNQPMGFYSLDALARDARRHGLQTLLPHLNRSDVACTSEGEDLRIGLGFIRGWGTDIAEEVVAERTRRGPFRSLPDFLRRTPATLKRPAIENLIWVGGMDCLGLSRRTLLWQTGLWLGPESDEKRTVDRGDHDQIQMILDGHFDSPSFSSLADTDKMVAEYRMLRLSTEHHPLTLMKDHLPAGTVSSDCFHRLSSGATVQLAGLVTARQRPGTAKGYVFVLMEDEHGPINVIVKPDLYEKRRMDVRMEPFLWVRGTPPEGRDDDERDRCGHRSLEGEPGGFEGGIEPKPSPDPGVLGRATAGHAVPVSHRSEAVAPGDQELRLIPPEAVGSPLIPPGVRPAASSCRASRLRPPPASPCTSLPGPVFQNVSKYPEPPMSLLESVPRFAAGLVLTGLLAAVPPPLAAQTTHFTEMDVFELEYATDPRISPDGGQVVYVRQFADVMTDRNYANLWIVGSDGSGHRPLTTGQFQDNTPRWSPDGTRIAFMSDREGTPQVHMLWVASGQIAPITNLTDPASGLSWSPDGQHLAFTKLVPEAPLVVGEMPAPPAGAEWAAPAKYTDDLVFRFDGVGELPSGTWHLFAVPSEGGTPRQLTSGDKSFAGFFGGGTEPAWTPDSQALLISANLRDDWELEVQDSEIYEIPSTARAPTP